MTKFNISALRNRVIQSKKWPSNKPCKVDNSKIQLIKKIRQINFKNTKADIPPFIKDRQSISIWSQEFFMP